MDTVGTSDGMPALLGKTVIAQPVSDLPSSPETGLGATVHGPEESEQADELEEHPQGCSLGATVLPSRKPAHIQALIDAGQLPYTGVPVSTLTEEQKTAKIAATFAFNSESLFTPKNKSHLFQKHPPADLTDPTVAADLAALTSEFEETLNPGSLPTLPPPKPKEAPSFQNAHNLIIDALLADPGATTKALANETGYSRGWISRILQSDSFQAKLAERTAHVIDPLVMQKIEDRMKGMASLALEILEEKLVASENKDLALEVLAATTKGLGLGQQKQGPLVAASFVVHVPAKIANAQDWAAQHSGRVVEQVGEGDGLGATEVPFLEKVGTVPHSIPSSGGFPFPLSPPSASDSNSPGILHCNTTELSDSATAAAAHEELQSSIRLAQVELGAAAMAATAAPDLGWKL